MKVKYVLRIEAELEEEEGWGDNCTLDQVKKQASDGIPNLKVFVQYYEQELRRVKAKITLDRLTIQC
jgi:hypothetical protein